MIYMNIICIALNDPLDVFVFARSVSSYSLAVHIYSKMILSKSTMIGVMARVG